MRTQNVKLELLIDDASLLSEFKEAIDKLEILLCADYSSGLTTLSFSKWVKEENYKGRLVNVKLSTKSSNNSFVGNPNIRVLDLNELTGYEIEYHREGLDIIKLDENPIKYSFRYV